MISTLKKRMWTNNWFWRAIAYLFLMPIACVLLMLGAERKEPPLY